MLTQSWQEGADGSLSRYHPPGFMGDGNESLCLAARWAGRLGIRATKTPECQL